VRSSWQPIGIERGTLLVRGGARRHPRPIIEVPRAGRRAPARRSTTADKNYRLTHTNRSPTFPVHFNRYSSAWRDCSDAEAADRTTHERPASRAGRSNGIRKRTVVPCPGDDSICKAPPTDGASVHPAQGRSGGCAAVRRVESDTVASCTISTTASVRMLSTWTCGVSVLQHVVQRLLRDAIDRRLLVRVR
jgi:hypothetical protein